MNPRSLACSIALGAALFGAAPLLAVQDHASHRAVQHGADPQSPGADKEGERVFEQNCARCHNAPDGLSPRITGTIVRHMRVRANLSRHDEQLLLQYFNQ
jgi:mono/diheme cytochrome c family protein